MMGMRATSASPLASFNAVNTLDPGAAEDEVARIFCPHRLTPVKRGAPDFHAIHNTARFDGFSVNYVTYGAEVEIDPGRLDRFFLLQIPLSGSADVTCGSVHVAASPDTASLLSPTLPTLMRWHRGCAKLIVLVDRSVVEGHLSALLDRHFDHVEFDASVALGGPAGQAIRAHAMLMQDAANHSVTLPAGTGRLVQRELRNGLVGLLLTGLVHDRSGLLAMPVPAPAPAHVKRVEEFLRAHPDREVSVVELAMIAGVSLRALQDGFRRFRNITMTEAIRDARLAYWRKLLEAPPQGAGVGSLALTAGLNHLGRSAALYYKRYGETPSETLRRNRRTN
ncbi:MAG: AraC family transcriptional regulator [Pseudorhodoplanes sp.]|uniref:AraC family transcriptional regulator n=1 Tax=Pseudorhodoplanes sp. TaxID=1934341 RepID=UPI003D0B7955